MTDEEIDYIINIKHKIIARADEDYEDSESMRDALCMISALASGIHIPYED